MRRSPWRREEREAEHELSAIVCDAFKLSAAAPVAFCRVCVLTISFGVTLCSCGFSMQSSSCENECASDANANAALFAANADAPPFDFCSSNPFVALRPRNGVLTGVRADSGDFAPNGTEKAIAIGDAMQPS